MITLKPKFKAYLDKMMPAVLADLEWGRDMGAIICSIVSAPNVDEADAIEKYLNEKISQLPTKQLKIFEG